MKNSREINMDPFRCTVKKCNKPTLYSFSANGEDTFDFNVCRKHMKELWEFIGEEISLSDES